MNRHTFALVFTTGCCLLCTGGARADWSRFRGPNGSGIYADTPPVPLRWSQSANLKWKTALPGPGVSSPIVVGERIYVTCYTGYGLDREEPGDMKQLKRHLLAIDRKDGKIIWNQTVDPVLPEDPYEGIGVPAHGYTSSTPVSDGQNIYVFFGKSGALAFDKTGKRLWQTSVGTESDPRRWGSASSPIVYKNLLIVPATAESQALVALDKTTGHEVWRQEAAGFTNSWCTPVLVEVDKERTDLVIGVTGELWGFNPDTGKLRWYCEGLNNDSYCSSLITQGGVVYAIEGRSGTAVAVRAGGQGNVTETHTVWKGRNSSRFPTPLVHGNRIYTVVDGVVTSLDAKTGDKLGQARLQGGDSASGGRRGRDYPSPILASGRLYYVNSGGQTFVIKTDDKLEQLAVNRLTTNDEVFSATPAASGGALFIRSDRHLYCVADLGQTPAEPAIPSAVAVDDPSAEGAGAAAGDGRGGRGRGGEGRGGRGRGDGRQRGGDPAQMFERQDANKDGKLSGDEIPERMRGFMEQMDTDKDGAITMDELRNARGRRGGGRGRGGRGGGDSRGDGPQRPQRPPLEGGS